MTTPIDESVLSQLVDGELDADRANDATLAALDDPQVAGQLRELIALRKAMGLWRAQGPPRAVLAVHSRAVPRRRTPVPWSSGSLGPESTRPQSS